MSLRFFSKNSRAVSQVVGYMMMLGLTTTVMLSVVYGSNIAINSSTKEAAEIMAEDLASVVSDAILNAVKTRRYMSDSSFEMKLDIPNDLAGRNYYIEITDSFVYVNSTDGEISKISSTLNADEFGYDISGKVYGGYGEVKVYCEKMRDVIKFDFGTPTSLVGSGYKKIHNGSVYTPLPSDWWNESFSYRTLIFINNSVIKSERVYGLVPQKLIDFQFTVSLSSSFFDYENCQIDGSDIRFYDPDYGLLNHSIEFWNPYSVSKIWVRFHEDDIIERNETKEIYMYYGNDSVEDISNSSAVFDFYEDFNDLSNFSDTWINFATEYDSADPGYVNITSGRAIATSDYEMSFNELSHDVWSTSHPNDYVLYDMYMIDAMMKLMPSSNGVTDADANLGFLKDFSTVSIPQMGGAGFPEGTKVLKSDKTTKKNIENLVENSDFVYSGIGFSTSGPSMTGGSHVVKDLVDTDGSGGTTYYDITVEGSLTIRADGDQLFATRRNVTGQIPHFESFCAIDPKTGEGSCTITCTGCDDVNDVSYFWLPASNILSKKESCPDCEGQSPPDDTCCSNTTYYLLMYDDVNDEFVFKEVTNNQQVVVSTDKYEIFLDESNSDDCNYVAYPSSGNLGFLTKAPQFQELQILDDVFDDAYVTSSKYNSSYGYTLHKMGDLSGAWVYDGLNGWQAIGSISDPLIEHSNDSLFNSLFLKRSAVMLAMTTNSSANSSSKYTLIGNARFNTTFDGNISSLHFMNDTWDTETASGNVELAAGAPYRSGGIAIGCNLNGSLQGNYYNGYVWLDWIRVWKSLMYTLNTSYGYEESLIYGWSSEVSSTVRNSPDNTVVYDFNMGSSGKDFVIGNLPVDTNLTITFTIGDNFEDYSTTISLYDDTTLIKSLSSSGSAGDFKTLSLPISNGISSGTLKLSFSGSRWIINAVQVEEGLKNIFIGA